MSVYALSDSGKVGLTEGLLDCAAARHAHGHFTRYGGIAADARRVIE